MKEINRRIKFSDETGMACGPMGIIGCDAEIQVDDDGKTVYIHGQWCSEADDLFFEATTESVYDVLMRMHDNIDNNDVLFDQLIPEKERIQKECTISDSRKYLHYLAELEKMIWQEVADRGYDNEEE